MSVTTVRLDTCPHAWCATTEPHSDEDGHWAEVPTGLLDALVDSVRIAIGLFDDNPGVNVSLELATAESGTTTQHLRDIARELLQTADRVDAMVGEDA